MNIKNVFLLLTVLFVYACGGDTKPKTSTEDSNSAETSVPKKPNMVYPDVYVNPSPETDYPTIYSKYKLPFLPKTEVVNQGEEVANLDEKFMLQLITEATPEEIIETYSKRFEEEGWEKGNVSIYSGAQKAILYQKGDEVEVQIIVIDEQNHRKIALLFEKPSEPTLEQ